MAFRQFLSSNKGSISSASYYISGLAHFSSKSYPYIVKVGIPEFLNGVGKGVEAHVQKLEAEIGDLQKLLVTRRWKLKNLDIPVKHSCNTHTPKTRGREDTSTCCNSLLVTMLWPMKLMFREEADIQLCPQV
nr:uncharacterized protein LOC113727815 isoform X1 [Coffea arabica]